MKAVVQPTQIKCVLTLCSHANQLLLLGIGETEEEQEASFTMLWDHISGSDDAMTAMRIARDLSGLLRQTLAFPAMENYVKNSDDSPLCLQLWQDLLLLQSTSAQVEGSMEDSMTDDDLQNKLFETTKIRIEESLSVIQYSLPIPVFLASATSLIEDEENGGLRTRALRFLAERAAGIDPNSAEAALFLDLLHSVVALMRGGKEDDESMLLEQSAAIVVEQLARTLSLPAAAPTGKTAASFIECLKLSTARLHSLSQKKTSMTPEGIVCQLACSLALSTSTLLRLLKARSLPVLPKLIDAILSFLTEASKSQSTDSSVQSQTRLVQVSMLRALTASAQNLPQFLIPHLDKFLSPDVLPSFSVEDTDLGGALAEKVPSRQLLPAVGRALKKCTKISEFLVLLNLTKASVEHTSRSEIGAVKGNVLNVILRSCDFDTKLLEVANEVLLALVMKLSEAQLRPVYAKLREWRGDDDADRKFSFWSLSAVLAKELKSIFLPCMSSVVNDALQELDAAAAMLCTAGKTKKLKVAGSIKALQYLPALLSCLSYCFAADAREGGSWVREDGDERYHAFMEPLSQLLVSKIPSDFPFSECDTKKDPYREVIVHEGGLITCLVALASAAGNETLWKPLNHAVLVACGNEDRTEIARAGLTCLLKLIQTLGEEYMVLLPECLPVLSELLEADEETAAIARDCVDISEDLLGESLEDSLK
jgi:U3 small nucleolar RNA-associated protein 10